MKTDNLTRDEALTALINGYKVTHHLFSSDEFIYMVQGIIYDESGYNMGTVCDEFMNIRRGGNWEGGWNIYF
jgi:hypothetical protein